MARTYYAAFSNVSVSVAQDIFEIAPATQKAVTLLGVTVTVRDDETNQQLEFTVQRRTGAFTSGSGGAAVTLGKTDSGDADPGVVVERNNDTRATGGTQSLFVAEGVPAQGGFAHIPTPEMQITAINGEVLVIGLENAPAAGITMSGWLALKEN